MAWALGPQNSLSLNLIVQRKLQEQCDSRNRKQIPALEVMMEQAQKKGGSGTIFFFLI